MTINIGGIIAIVLFYLLILAVGIWAAKKKPEGEDDADDVMLAGRSIGVFVGIFTMTGETVGMGQVLKVKCIEKWDRQWTEMRDEDEMSDVFFHLYTDLIMSYFLTA